MAALAIIALLGAVLLPVFASGRNSARQMNCLSNEKQMALGILEYTEDNDQRFPMAEYTGQPSGQYKSWREEINPYVRAGEMTPDGQGDEVLRYGVWSCPEFPDRQQTAQYGVNWALCPEGTQWPPVSQCRIVHPNLLVLICEKGRNNSGSGDSDWSYPYFIPWEAEWTDHVFKNPGDPTSGLNPNAKHFDLMTRAQGGPVDGDCDYPADGSGTDLGCGSFPRYRHDDRCSFAFADGHVEAIPRGQLDWYRNIWWGYGSTPQ